MIATDHNGEKVVAQVFVNLIGKVALEPDEAVDVVGVRALVILIEYIVLIAQDALLGMAEKLAAQLPSGHSQGGHSHTGAAHASADLAGGIYQSYIHG